MIWLWRLGRAGCGMKDTRFRAGHSGADKVTCQGRAEAPTRAKASEYGLLRCAGDFICGSFAALRPVWAYAPLAGSLRTSINVPAQHRILHARDVRLRRSSLVDFSAGGKELTPLRLSTFDVFGSSPIITAYYGHNAGHNDRPIPVKMTAILK